VLDRAIIHILLIIEHNGKTSFENLRLVSGNQRTAVQEKLYGKLLRKNVRNSLAVSSV